MAFTISRSRSLVSFIFSILDIKVMVNREMNGVAQDGTNSSAVADTSPLAIDFNKNCAWNLFSMANESDSASSRQDS